MRHNLCMRRAGRKVPRLAVAELPTCIAMHLRLRDSTLTHHRGTAYSCRIAIPAAWRKVILQELPRILLLERDDIVASHLAIHLEKAGADVINGGPCSGGAATARAIHV